jgi:hypothetical protein
LEKNVASYLIDLQQEARAGLNPLLQLSCITKLGEKRSVDIVFQMIEGSSDGGQDCRMCLRHDFGAVRIPSSWHELRLPAERGFDTLLLLLSF